MASAINTGVSGGLGMFDQLNTSPEYKSPNLTKEAIAHGYKLGQWRKIKPIYELIAKYEAGMEEANRANELRYQQGLGILGDIYSQYSAFNPAPQVPYYHEYGKGQRADIEEQRRAGTAEAMSGLMGSGLAASSVAPAVASQYRRQAATQNMNLSDAIAQYQQGRRDYLYQQNLDLQRERLSNLAGVQGQKLNWIYGKEDLGPSAEWSTGLINLMSKTPGRWSVASEPYKRSAQKQIAASPYTTR